MESEAGARVTIEDGLAVLALDDGRPVNVLSSPRLTALAELLSRLFDPKASPRVRALLIVGNDRGSFSAGADLREIARLDPEAAMRLSRRGGRVMRKLIDAPVPTGALITGHALGGGFDLALSVDVTVATPESVFAHPGVSRGFFTGWGGTARIPCSSRARGFVRPLLTGEILPASEARALGLVAEVLSQDAARAWIERTLRTFASWPIEARDAWRAARVGARARPLSRALLALARVDTPESGC
ncbi:MAG: enoyl-CoA hydratase/isomerase family protein [Acidobacteria bacterium]|nr:enoyl-CoA hydratase/isomerase family protein [Acidobacteriota bacterium]